MKHSEFWLEGVIRDCDESAFKGMKEKKTRLEMV